LINNFQSGIIVYDPHQSIYMFRGAVNTVEIDQLDCKYSRTLNSTFRFGGPLAILVSKFVKIMKKNYENFNVVSVDNKQTYYKVAQNIFDFYNFNDKFLLLSRTNVNLIQEGMFIINKKPDVKFHSIGGSKALEFHILEIKRLIELKITNLENFSKLEALHKKQNNIPMLSKIKFVKENNSYELLEKLEKL